MAVSMINIFKATFRDISRNNRFLVWLPGFPPDLIAHCIAVNIPGESFATNQSYDQKVGTNVIPWELPYDITQNECQMTFMVDFEYRTRSYFDRWRAEVFDPTRGFGYLDKYAKDVKIFQLSRQYIPTYTVTLEQAYPKTITDIGFDAASQNGYSTFSVNLVYGGQRRTDTLGWVLSKIGVDRPSFI
jgi:hypothetical protein